MKKDIFNIIKYPITTEKGTSLNNKNNQYTFVVHQKADKLEIKNAIQKIFNVHVTKVNVLKMPGRLKRFKRSLVKVSGYKKAIITLQEGNKINIFEGV